MFFLKGFISTSQLVQDSLSLTINSFVMDRLYKEGLNSHYLDGDPIWSVVRGCKAFKAGTHLLWRLIN